MTGTPNFLATMFNGENPLPQIDKDLRVKAESLVIVNLDKLPFIPVLVQTGYLTIVGEDRSGYRLDFPNHEVASSYALWSIVSATQKDAITIQSLGSMLVRQLEQGNFDAFFQNMIPLFAAIPHDIHVGD
jgi:hypothetical protein